MGSADPVDDRTFNGNFSDEGVAKLKEMVKHKLKEYMKYTDDTLVEYVIVLLRNGRRKEEAKNELTVFLEDDSDSFITWLWDHLAESVDEYFTSLIEQTTNKGEDKALVLMDSETEKGRSGTRRSRQWRSQPTNAPDIPPLLSSEVHRIHNYEKNDHKQRRDKRSPSPQSQSHRKRTRTDDSRKEQREAKPDVSRRLLQFAVRDALAIPKPPKSSTGSSLKRLRSVVAASTQDSSDPDPAPKIRSVARVVNPMAAVIKAVAEAAEDVKNPKSGKSVFDRISHSTGFSGTRDQHMVNGEVPPVNEESRNFIQHQEPIQHKYTPSLDNNGVYDENMTTFDTSLQPNVSSGRSRLNSSANAFHPSTFPGNRINNPKSLQHRLVNDLKRVEVSSSAASYGTLLTRPLEDASSRTIYVTNVHFGATKDSVSRHFNKFGEVLKAIIVTDPATGQPSGSAYIEFTRKEAADNALSLDGTSFMTRILKIVKGSNVQQQEAGSSMTWPRAGRFTRAASSYRRGGGPFRGRSVVRAGGRSMQWKRDSAETGNNVVAPSPRSLTYVRTESRSDGGNAAI